MASGDVAERAALNRQAGQSAAVNKVDAATPETRLKTHRQQNLLAAMGNLNGVRQ